MEESITLLTKIKEAFACEGQDVRAYSPLTLAYIGDGIYELVIRSVVVERANRSANDLHKKTTRYVKAPAQSAMIEALLPELTEEEEAVYRRGRNAKSYTTAKNASVADYRRATGFEALMGYLYLTGQIDRMLQLIKDGIVWQAWNCNKNFESLKSEEIVYKTIQKFTIERTDMGYQEFTIEGRNAVIEAYRAGKPIDKLFILDGCQDGPMMTIKREAKKHDTLVKYVTKERLDQLSETGKHQGVIAYAAAYEYAEVDDILEAARKKGEPPFIFLLDNIEDPHNLGAIIRTANLAGAHGVIIPKNRAAGLTATVARTSAGALNYTPVAKVTNLAKTIEELKKEGLWFVCADMGGTTMYDLNLKGPIGLVIGNEGEGVGRLVKEKCDMVASIPMKGDIDSLNASVATGVLAYEIVRQRLQA